MHALHCRWVFLLAALLAWSAATAAEASKPYPPTASYQQIFSAMAQARERALEENKLLLYVMGANWCHDSTDFVAMTKHPELAQVIEQRYVLQLINVGYFDFVREVITRFDQPVIYGTPTVLIVEPRSNRLLNADSTSVWRNASTMSDADALQYFSAYRAGHPQPQEAPPGPALAAALAQVDAFEKAQAERIYLAYAELGTAMATLEEGQKPGPAWREKWDQLASMRSRITADLAVLRDSAREQVAAGVSPVALDYPHYPLFID
jgi:hypothetical protein